MTAEKRRSGGPAAADALREYRGKRDFGRTREPRGEPGKPTPEGAELAFVVQKHAARNLHFDLRLELDGVMKSWAVPKGPSLDPETRRLAIHVEDHPMDYNTFEGRIEEGEYGAGSVMIWDCGSWRAPDGSVETLRQGYARGRLTFVLEGERLRGLFHLIRTKGDDSRQEQWLLTKGEDDFAKPGRDVVAEVVDSVVTGRTMEEIAEEEEPTTFFAPQKTAPAPPPGFRPMLAHTASGMPAGEGWVFEPKYDGIRVLAFAAPDSVALITRNGRDKARQFPELVHALRELAEVESTALVLDGEIVALRDGAVARFQALQSRTHEQGAANIGRFARESPAAFMAFDLLLEGEDVLFREPWTERRERLESLLRDAGGGRFAERVRLGEVERDGEALLGRARGEGWEGLIAKRAGAPYEPGRRSRAWLKVKVENRQEFVVGGYTEPRGGRRHIGALLVGWYDEEGKLRVAGHVGTGFSDAALEEMHARLRRLSRKTHPFAEAPKTNQPAHWVTPRVVVEVRFNEWTDDGGLRHPVFLGVREDKEAREVRREPPEGTRGAAEPTGGPEGRSGGRSGANVNGGARGEPDEAPGPRLPDDPALEDVVRQLRSLEDDRGSGTLDLPDAPPRRLDVTNLDKVFFPGIGGTKGDLMRHYAGVAPFILPTLADRPLVLKRFPNGIDGKSFYQQNAGDSVPEGVRVETIVTDEGEEQRRLVGGDLATLLYTVQLGAISVDPWHSRVGTLEFADYAVLDLDPGKGTEFPTVVEVAKRVKDELDRLGLHAALKSSGATGLHICVPMPPETPNDAAQLVARIVAARVAARAPRIATVERMVRSRPRGTVYVDFLQNILGKTVAGVYAARARPAATVSTPLRWSELTPRLTPTSFTIRNFASRIHATGDLWGPAMARKNSLDALLESAAR